MDILHTGVHMVIYQIRNCVNNKLYIGQTRQKNPLRRWWYHRFTLRRNEHVNDHLQRSWNKHGESAFVFEIIETCKSLEELNVREIYHISRLKHAGYNMAVGGDVRICSDVTRKRLSVSCSKAMESKRKSLPAFKSPSGEIIITKGLNTFCKEHNLRRDRVRLLISGEITQHKGWTLFVPKKTARRQVKSNVTYTITDPSGTVYRDVRNLTVFAKSHGLTISSFRLIQYSYNRGTKYNDWRIESTKN